MMNVFKTSVGSSKVYFLNRETYIEQSEINEKLHMYENGKEMFYAVCPICDNPVSIVNLFKEEKKIYGRHHNKSVAELAKLDIASRNSCKYYTGREKDKEGSQRPKNAKVNKIYCKSMKDDFDIHLAFFEHLTGIRIKEPFALEKLDAWIINDKSKDFECTDTTLPFTLFYGLIEHGLYGRCIHSNSPAYQLLSSKPLSDVVELKYNKNTDLYHIEGKAGVGYFVLNFNFGNYERKVSNSSCIETMTLNVLYRKHASDDAEIFREKITIDSDAWYVFRENYSKPRNKELLGKVERKFAGVDVCD